MKRFAVNRYGWKLASASLLAIVLVAFVVGLGVYGGQAAPTPPLPDARQAAAPGWTSHDESELSGEGVEAPVGQDEASGLEVTTSALFDDAECASGSVIVQLASGSNIEDVLSAAVRETGMSGFEGRQLIDDHWMVDLPASLTVDEALECFGNLVEVGAAQPNFVYRAQAEGEAADASTGSSGSPDDDVSPASETAFVAADALLSTAASAEKIEVNDTYASRQWAIDAIHLKEAWALARNAGAVSDTPKKVNRTVAVLDEGFNVEHEDVKAAIVDTFDAYQASTGVKDGQKLKDVSPAQSDSHGTHVMGIVGAIANNGKGIAGASYNAQLQLVKCAWKNPNTETVSITTAALASGIGHVISTAKTLNTHVISMSIGGRTNSTNFDKTLTDAIDKAFANDIVIVGSAGNRTGSDPIPYINYPSDYSTIVAVINVANEPSGADKYSRFSSSNYNMGDDDWNKNISAPGTSIFSTVNTSEKYGVKNGTSMAAPHVSGVLSLMFAVNDKLTAKDAVGILYKTTLDLRKAENRAGTTFDSQTGYGLVNAQKAVEEALVAKPSKDDGPDPTPVASTTLKRLAGANALDTMSAIDSQKTWEQGGTVVLVTSGGYWDGLTANGVAGLTSAPIVMTEGTRLSTQAKKVIAALKPSTIVVAGGPDAVAESVAQAARLAAGTSPTVVRMWGNHADDTANALFRKGTTVSGTAKWATTAFVCTDAGFWDALSAAPISYAKHYPIFLTRHDGTSLSDDTLRAMKEGGITDVRIVGETDAVSPSVQKQLKDAGFKVGARLGGSDAIATSQLVAEFGLTCGMTANYMGFATSKGYWDALAGAALCGKQGGVLAIVDGSKAVTITGFAAKNKATVAQAYIFGGTAAISSATESAIRVAFAR